MAQIEIKREAIIEGIIVFTTYGEGEDKYQVAEIHKVINVFFPEEAMVDTIANSIDIEGGDYVIPSRFDGMLKWL